MRNNQFNQIAKFYDILYQDKDYPAEIQFLLKLIESSLGPCGKDTPILDLACGTGRHLLELGKLGYTCLSGSDLSRPMIEFAKESASKSSLDIDFYNYSFEECLSIQRRFRVVLSLFSAVDYLASRQSQVLAFQNIHGLLEEDGVFIFDFWNGNAVSRDFSPTRVVHKTKGLEEIYRISYTRIDRLNQSAEVKFRCLHLEEGIKKAEFTEIHSLHYYYLPEMFHLLDRTGYEVVKVVPFMEPERDVEPYDWNITLVARRK
jgi:SAM-dependent methyltransferase